MCLKKILLLLVFTAGCIFTVYDSWGKDKKQRKPKKQRQQTNKISNKPIPGMFTVTGVVSKTTINDKEVYILTAPSGNIVNLPTPKEPKQGQEESTEIINIQEYLDKKVAIFGKGFSRKVKNSPNPKVFIKEIISIREVNIK